MPTRSIAEDAGDGGMGYVSYIMTGVSGMVRTGNGGMVRTLYFRPQDYGLERTSTH